MASKPSAELLSVIGGAELPVPVADEKASVRLEDLVAEALLLRDEVIPAQENVVKEAKARYDELRKILIPEAMQFTGLVDSTGHGSFTHSSGARVHLNQKVYASVLKDNKPALLEWLRENKFTDLIKEDVHPQTLTAFCKERLEDGEAIPPMVKTYEETQATFVNPKRKDL